MQRKTTTTNEEEKIPSHIIQAGNSQLIKILVIRRHIKTQKESGFYYSEHGNSYRCTRSSKPYQCRGRFKIQDGKVFYKEEHNLSCKRLAKRNFIATIDKEDGESIQVDISRISSSVINDPDLNEFRNKLDTQRRLFIQVQDKQLIDSQQLMKSITMNTEQNIQQFLKKNYKFDLIAKRSFEEVRKRYPQIVLLTQAPNQRYFQNDAFYMGVGDEMLASVLNVKIYTLMAKQHISQEQILVMISQLREFLETKGQAMGKGRAPAEINIVDLQKNTKLSIQSTLSFPLSTSTKATEYSQKPIIGAIESYTHDIRCCVCLDVEPILDLLGTPCCKVLIHQKCWQVVPAQDSMKTREELRLMSDEQRNQARKKICAGCRNVDPQLVMLTEAHVDYLRQTYSKSQGQFDQAMLLVQENNKALEEYAEQQKRLTLQNYDDELVEISDDSQNIQVSSQDAITEFTTILAVSEVNTASLTSANNVLLKLAKQKSQSYKRKVVNYAGVIKNTRQEMQSLIQDLGKQSQKRPSKVGDRRKTQLTRARNIVKESKDILPTTNDWLNYLNQVKELGTFSKCGAPICDIIIMNKIPILFSEGSDHDTKLGAFLRTQQIQVSYIRPTAKNDGKQVSIKLDDQHNVFNDRLMKQLQETIMKLKEMVRAEGINQGISEEGIIALQSQIFISQMDYTQDLKGFFVVLDKKDALKQLEQALNVKESKEHKQLMTCLQLVQNEEITLNDGTLKSAMKHRVKIYNKSVHLLTSGQVKKWLNMKLNDLLKPSHSFYHYKIYPSQNTCLSRIEISSYYFSAEDWALNAEDKYQDAIDLSEATYKFLLYSSWSLLISQSEMIESYFSFANTAKCLVAFEEDLWVIVYYFNQSSSTFSGHEVNKTSKSGSRIAFLKRYLYPGATCQVFFNGRFIGECKKVTGKMQLPLSSLNEKHTEQFVFYLSRDFSYYLNRDELTKIQVQTESQELQEMLSIPSIEDYRQLLGKRSRNTDNFSDQEEEIKGGQAQDYALGGPDLQDRRYMLQSKRPKFMNQQLNQQFQDSAQDIPSLDDFLDSQAQQAIAQPFDQAQAESHQHSHVLSRLQDTVAYLAQQLHNPTITRGTLNREALNNLNVFQEHSALNELNASQEEQLFLRKSRSSSPQSVIAERILIPQLPRVRSRSASYDRTQFHSCGKSGKKNVDAFRCKLCKGRTINPSKHVCKNNNDA